MSDPSRRHTLTLLGASALVGCKTTRTVVDPLANACESPTGSQTEGPYYPGEPEVQADITEGRTGIAMELALTIVTRDGCTPVAGAEVDIWCADAAGDYSGYEDFGTDGEDWLRGQQTTDAEGIVRFTTIVPGAYPGRAVHFHVKVRAQGQSELTTQVYLPDDMVEAVLADSAYADSARQVRNDADNFYTGDTLLEVSGDVASGYTAAGALVL